jgi:hypothetical protein
MAVRRFLRGDWVGAFGARFMPLFAATGRPTRDLAFVEPRPEPPELPVPGDAGSPVRADPGVSETEGRFAPGV